LILAQAALALIQLQRPQGIVPTYECPCLGCTCDDDDDNDDAGDDNDDDGDDDDDDDNVERSAIIDRMVAIVDHMATGLKAAQGDGELMKITYIGGWGGRSAADRLQLGNAAANKDVIALLTGLNSSLSLKPGRDFHSAHGGEKLWRPTTEYQRFLHRLEAWLATEVMTTANLVRLREHFFVFALARVRGCRTLRACWHEAVRGAHATPETEAAALGAVVVRVLKVRLDTFLGYNNLRTKDTRRQLATRRGGISRATTGKGFQLTSALDYVEAAVVLLTAARDNALMNVAAGVDSSDGGSADNSNDNAEVRGVAADSAKAAWFLRLTDAADDDSIADADDIGECPLARGDVIFAVLLPDGYIPTDGVGLEVESVALGGKSSGTSGLVITAVTMPDYVVEKLQFFGLPDSEPATIRPGDRLLAANGTILCNRPVLHVRGLLDRTSNPRTYLVLRNTTAQATRATTQKVRGGGGGGGGTGTAKGSGANKLVIRGAKGRRSKSTRTRGRQASAPRGASRPRHGNSQAARHRSASKHSSRKDKEQRTPRAGSTRPTKRVRVEE
jgi:hypothetical protein